MAILAKSHRIPSPCPSDEYVARPRGAFLRRKEHRLAATAAGRTSCDRPERHVARFVLASTVSPNLRSWSALACDKCLSPRGLPSISYPEECAMRPNTPLHHVVIIGGGFGGLY